MLLTSTQVKRSKPDLALATAGLQAHRTRVVVEAQVRAADRTRSWSPRAVQQAGAEGPAVLTQCAGRTVLAPQVLARVAHSHCDHTTAQTHRLIWTYIRSFVSIISTKRNNNAGCKKNLSLVQTVLV